MLKQRRRKEKRKKSVASVFQFLLVPVCLLVIAMLYKHFIADGVMNGQTTADQLAYIADHVRSNGDLFDPSGDIRMNDPSSDIRLYVVDNKSVQLKFGLILMEWNWKDFWEESNVMLLEHCGFRVFIDTEQKLQMYYKGVYIPRKAAAY